MTEHATRSAAEMTMSPVEQVLAQLGRQRWAIDSHDIDALRDTYTVDCELVIHRGGPDGPFEIARVHGRDDIVRFTEEGWERTADTWFPGSSIHHGGSEVTEPTGDGCFRCRSYAAYLEIDRSGAPRMRGYGTYDDVWALEDGVWRLSRREMSVYGLDNSASR